ncbi:arrestin domain-containing protein 17-like isoform X2 [Bradysia coprophila]|uniref:arrestin domain-containing protein 17-like isoform X2 n=1 Tax=Bradysia coprophila TaxID=38358 RepID=UPI00187DB433|nr:arrestin domain-containing protein 17-like isoform X2 [Bradysia coprophila]
MGCSVKGIISELTERKVNKCTIELCGNASNVYYSGQLISGTVQLILNEKKKVRDILVKVLGVAYVRWIEPRGRNDNVNKGKEIIFDKKIELIHDSDDTVQLMPGLYYYPFECKLPHCIPSSLELKYGYIRYKVQTVLDNLLWSSEEFEKFFTVIGVSELTPHMLEPVTIHNQKTFNLYCYLSCIPSDPLATVAKIPSCGYLPRQTIDLHLHVNNRSTQPVIEFTVQLIQKIQYHTHTNSSRKKIDKIVLKQEYREGCKPGEVQEMDVNIVVPTVPPSQNTYCNIIKIDYFIRIIVSVPWFHSDSELYLPINIGSGPIQDDPTVPAWINPLANDF